MLLEVEAWLNQTPNLLFLLVVSLIGMFWDEMVAEPLAKRRFRKMIEGWSALELKSQLEKRKRGK